MAPLQVLHPSVESGEEEEEVLAVDLLVAGDEWHHTWVLHPPGERGEEEEDKRQRRVGWEVWSAVEAGIVDQERWLAILPGFSG
jgi:hypothetical protein